MNDNLRNSVALYCSKILKTMLLTQKELMEDRKEKGVRVYSLDEYNKLMNVLFPNGFWTSDKKNLVISRMESDLSNNLVLTDEEIEELVTEFNEKIMTFDFKFGNYNNFPITYLVEQVIDSGKFDSNSKWNMTLSSSCPLGINPSLMMYCVYRTHLFIIQNINRKYFCYLDKEGDDRIEEFPIFRRTNDKFLLKNLYVVLTNEECEDFVYKDGDLYQSVRINSSYKDEMLKNKISVNSILDKIGVHFDEVLDLMEITDIERLIYNYSEVYNEIDSIVASAVEKMEMLIFDEASSLGCQDYMDLIPSYTGKQKGRFKKELFNLIKMELLKNGELELDLIPRYSNKLGELLDRLFIIPSPLIIGKVMKIDLETKEIVLKDKQLDKEEVVYSLKTSSSGNKEKRLINLKEN